MPYLINPFGRIVAVNDVKQYENLIKLQGFKPITPEQEKEHIKSRIDKVESMNNTKDPSNGLFFSTVSQGGADGYATSSKNLIKELQNLGTDVGTYYKGQKVAILFHAPYGIASIEAPYRIIYTMFESDKIPDDWIDYLKSADLVLVPSKWCSDVFAKSGIKTMVVPLGYDDNIFKYKARINKRKAKKPFVFLHYNAFNIRKGFLEVLKAFNKAFDKTEPVKMIFKTTLEQLPLPITPAEYPNIEIIRGKVSQTELLDILHKSDCFVFPSRGEGFGMTPLEAMATGIPAIIPNAHGISEYFNQKYMYEVKIESTCPALYSRYKGQDVGKMVICDIDDLAKQMRYVYEHQDEALQKGEMVSEYVKSWTYKNTANTLKGIIDGVITKPIDIKRNIGNVLTLEKIT